MIVFGDLLPRLMSGKLFFFDNGEMAPLDDHVNIRSVRQFSVADDDDFQSRLFVIARTMTWFFSLSFPAAWQIDFLMRTAYFAIHTNSYNLTWLAVRERRRNFRCLSFVAEHDPSIASGKEEFWCNRDWKKLLPERENLPIPYIIYGQEKRAMPRDSLSFGMSLGDIFVCPPTTQK